MSVRNISVSHWFGLREISLETVYYQYTGYVNIFIDIYYPIGLELPSEWKISVAVRSRALAALAKGCPAEVHQAENLLLKAMAARPK